MQLERAVSGAAVQKDGGPHHGNLRDEGRNHETQNEREQHSTTLRRPTNVMETRKTGEETADSEQTMIPRKRFAVTICVSRRCSPGLPVFPFEFLHEPDERVNPV